MIKKYMTLDELSDWAATELYEVADGSDSQMSDMHSERRIVLHGLEISPNKLKQESLKKIIENPDADWKESGIDEEIIEQIRMAKHDNSDSSKGFMTAINLFISNRFNTDTFNYAYKHIKEIKNRLIRTVLAERIVSAPGRVKPKDLSDTKLAELVLDLLYAYPYTDHKLIGGNAGMIDLYLVSHNYDIHQVYDWFYQLMWNRILAHATKAEPDITKIENLCNVAVHKLNGINKSGPVSQQDKNISEYSLRKIFNTKNVLDFVKEHADEIKQKQYQDFFNQIRINEAQALLYKQATNKKHAPHHIVLTQKNAKNME